LMRIGHTAREKIDIKECYVKINMDNHFTFADLFCGIGSFHFSLEKLGGKCVMACDINAAFRETYERNYGIRPLGDICEIDADEIPDFDILCGGFPCQPFSNIGHQQGFEDERGTLIYRVADILTHKRPKAFILENVRGLLNHDEGKTFERVLSVLKDVGYEIHHKVLSCDDHGIPQMRKRLFIVGIDKVIGGQHEFEFAVPTCATPDLTEFFGKKFERSVAFTVRCGGRKSNINNRHNWDRYMVDGKVYTLDVEDMKKLQGFPPEFELVGSEKQKEQMLGNTIPTNLTRVVGKLVVDHLATIS